MDLKELVIKIKGDSSSAEGALNRIGGIVKAVIAGAAVVAMVKFGESCINAAAASQSAQVLLGNSLGNIAGMTDKAKESAIAWVEQMKVTKAFSDEDLSTSLMKLSTKTNDLAVGEALASTAMEVARFKGISLSDATNLVSLAYDGSARSLHQFGIELGPDGKAPKGMDAINALQLKVAGSGEAWSKTLEGQRAQFNTTFNTFKESVGTVLMPLAEKFMSSIMPYLQKAMEWIQAHMPQIEKVMGDVMTGVSFAFKIAGDIINGVIVSIKWIIEHAKEAVDWIKGVAANTGVNQGMGIAQGGGHAAGGWVGLNGPEVALVGEKGPEYISPAGSSIGSDRAVLDRLDAIINAVTRVAPGVASAVNGLGRGV